VKTNVLFFQKGVTPIGNTRHVWIYDLRSNGQNFGKRNQLNRSHFTEFEEAYRETPRIDRGEAGRWRCFSREDIAKRGDNLDISWLKDESLESGEDLGTPDEIAIDILSKLKLATMEIVALQELLK
jgi:type I restriction enzyme M protein